MSSRKSRWNSIKIVDRGKELNDFKLDNKGRLIDKLTKKRSHPERWDDYHKVLGNEMCFPSSFTSHHQVTNEDITQKNPTHDPFPPPKCDDAGITQNNHSTVPSSGHVENISHLEGPFQGPWDVGECNLDDLYLFNNILDYPSDEEEFNWQDEK